MKQAETQTRQTSGAAASGINISQRAHPSEREARAVHSTKPALPVRVTSPSLCAAQCLDSREAAKGILEKRATVGQQRR